MVKGVKTKRLEQVDSKIRVAKLSTKEESKFDYRVNRSKREDAYLPPPRVKF